MPTKSNTTPAAAAESTPLKSDKDLKELSAASIDDRITPEAYQRNPNLAPAVDPEHINRNIDTVAARGEVNPANADLTTSEGTGPKADDK